MNKRILWGSEVGKCSSCGCNRESTRLYSSESTSFTFCQSCWVDFLNECKIGNREWVQEVHSEWSNDTVFVLIPEGSQGGTSPQSRNWS